MRVRLNHILKDNYVKRTKLLTETSASILTVTVQCTTSAQQLVKQLRATLPCTCRMHAVVMFSVPSASVYRFFPSSRRSQTWLIHDAEVILDGHSDDVRTIRQLEQGFILPHERDLSSKPHSLLSFFLSSHDQSVRRLKQCTFFPFLSFLFNVLFTSLCFLCLPISWLEFGALLRHVIVCWFSSRNIVKTNKQTNKKPQ